MSEWIPKDLWMATQFACKLIRENHWFNKDCQTAADYYDVNVEDVMAQVRKRQSAGQKRANASSPKKRMKWFVTEHASENRWEAYGWDGFEVHRGYQADAVERRLWHRYDYGTDMAVVIAEFETEEEAKNECKRLNGIGKPIHWDYSNKIAGHTKDEEKLRLQILISSAFVPNEKKDVYRKRLEELEGEEFARCVKK